jgi:triacylglycerol lipase
VQPSTSYHFRLSAWNSGGEVTGGSGSFTTPAACPAPTVTTEAASSITASTARLNGRVNPNGCSTEYTFEYGLAASGTYTKVTGSAGSGTGPVSVWKDVSGLQAGKMYTFRLSAKNSKGNTDGSFLYFSTVAAPVYDPILFVHGWEGNAQTFATYDAWFQQKGWPISRLYLWSYDTNQSNAVTAQEISSKVDTLLKATGASKVDIVTHSMGGLSSRYYLKNLGGTSKVDEWVSLGGPNHGTDTALFCFYQGCKDMQTNSTFLQALNSGDETPGAVRYATWRSWCDSVVEPPSSVMLSGAVYNTETSCLFHTELHEDYPTFEQVLSFIK